MKLADKIKFNLMPFIRSSPYDIIIPNFYCGWYEMDVFRILSSGYIVEYEIKISKSDFKADFDKGKGHKHLLFSNKKSKANRFYYVTPKGLLNPSDIPAYAGLIEYSETQWGHNFDIVKSAPLIHKVKEKESIYRWIARKLSFREVILQSKYRKLKQK